MRKIVLFLILITAFSCNQQRSKSKQTGLYEVLFTNKLNINEAIKDSMSKKGVTKYRVFPNIIKAGILVSTIRQDAEADQNDFYFLVYSLKTKKIEWLVHNPFKELGFQELEYDYDENKIFAYSQKTVQQVSYYDCLEKRIDYISMANQNLDVAPGAILVNKNFIFFSRSPLGALVYNMATKKSLSFRNNHANTISHIYSSIALPLSDSLNLVSGKRDEGGISAILFDSLFQIKAKTQIKDDNFASDGYFKILSMKDGYAIFNRTESQFIDNKKVEKKWKIIYKGDFKNAFELSGQKLLCVVSDSGRTNLLCIDSENGNKIWDKEFRIRVSPNHDIAINNERKTIVLAGRDSIWQLNYYGINTGVMRSPNSEGFQVLEDYLNGDNYIFFNDKVLYW